MKKNLNIIIALFCIVIIVGFFVLISVFKPSNWNTNFEAYNNDPFGLSIFEKEIDSLLPNSKITRINQNLIDYIYVNDSLNSTILYINQNFTFFGDEWDYIQSYTDLGNDIFVIANNITAYSDFIIKDSVKVNPTSKLTFTNPDLKKYETNFIYKTSFETISISDTTTYITPYEKEILGNINNQNVFYRFKMGNGNLYIHHLPHVFSNHYLKNNTVAYPSAVLSYIKQKNITLINNAFPYYALNEDSHHNNKSILYFILGNKYLKTAWYLFLFVGICFVLFKIKRTQRIIPILPENKNRSVEFVQTISNLYYNQDNLNSIVKHMCTQFLDKIESKYQLNTSKIDENFIKLLSKYTNQNENFIKDVLSKVGMYQHSNTNPSKEQINDLYIKMKKIIK